MQFVNPLYLFGLLAVAIPVIIHLFNFRRFRKVYFTNVKYISKLQQETQKSSRLRHWLILAARILAVAALVFAFAQPYIPYNKQNVRQTASRAVSVFVDNSFSMEAVGANGELLHEAKKKAREIVSAYKPTDGFQLLTCDFEGKHQRMLTREEFLSQLEQVKISPVSRTFSEIISRQGDLLQASGRSLQQAFIISDFQKLPYSALEIKRDTNINLYLAPLRAPQPANVSIDSCSFTQPTRQLGQVSVLQVQVTNFSENNLEKIPIRLYINGKQKTVASANLKAGATQTVQIPFTVNEAGFQQGVLSITDHPVVFDDTFYFSFVVQDAIKVLAVNGNGENKFLTALFFNDSSVRLSQTPEKLLRYNELPNYNLLILNEVQSVSSGLLQELNRYVEQGGSLLIIPAANAELTSYNALLATLNVPLYKPLDTTNVPVTRLSDDSPLLRGVFEQNAAKRSLPENMELPKVSSYFPIQLNARSRTTVLIELLNKNPFLTLTQQARGQVFQLAVGLQASFSNFQHQAIFVPVLYNIALLSQPPQQLYSFLGSRQPIQVSVKAPEGDKAYKIVSANPTFEVIPQLNRMGNSLSILAGNQIPFAGNFNLVSDKQSLAPVSFNYNRAESNPACLSDAELTNLFEKQHIKSFEIFKDVASQPLDKIISSRMNGVSLWKYFIVFALLMLLAEGLLIRFGKR